MSHPLKLKLICCVVRLPLIQVPCGHQGLIETAYVWQNDFMALENSLKGMNIFKLVAPQLDPIQSFSSHRTSVWVGGVSIAPLPLNYFPSHLLRQYFNLLHSLQTVNTVRAPSTYQGETLSVSPFTTSASQVRGNHWHT